MKDLDISNIDLEADADLGTVLQEAQNITSKSYILKDSTTAKADMKKSISLYNKYDYLWEDKNLITKEYYLFNMPSDGNIIFTETGVSATMFDTNLNKIDLSDTGAGSSSGEIYSGRTMLLSAGTYILRFTSIDAGDSITINSPVFD